MASPLLYNTFRVLILVIPLLLWGKGQDFVKNLQWGEVTEETSIGRAKRDAPSRDVLPTPITLFGVSAETNPEISGAIKFGANGSVTLLEEMSVNLVLFGLFTEATKIRYAMHEFSCEVDSDMEEPPTYEISLDVDAENIHGTVVGRVYDMELPSRSDYPRIYFCLSEDNVTWIPQGNSLGTHFYLTSPALPIWLRILFLLFLLTLSGLFSGLSLGLMSLDKTNLSIVSSTGSAQEKKYASKIAPVRKHGNFLLCSLLFSNVLVNACITLMMDSLMSGAFAVASATLAIVIFGEVIPQSVCSRHGMAVGAHTIFITKFSMGVTSPLAWPLSLLLDKVLGEEIGAVYTRERLKELLVVTDEYHGLDKEELALIAGALGMKSKTVGDVMTPLSSVFMLSIDSNLDYKSIAEIEFQAFSRIPIYEKDRQNIVAILNLKHITPLDAGENICFGSIVDHYSASKEIVHVAKDASLYFALRKFRSGPKSHMVIVHSKNQSEDGIETTSVVGILTMEDILEELLQTKIMDEKDIDKLYSRRGKISVTVAPNLAAVAVGTKNKEPVGRRVTMTIPPPLALAAISHLTANVAAFSRTEISGIILNRIIKSAVKRAMPAQPGEPDQLLLKAGQPAEGFLLILEGNVEVLAGNEKIPFGCGPYMCFGTNFLYTGEKKKESIAGLIKSVPARDSSGKGFQRISTHFKRRQTLQLRRMSTVLSTAIPEIPPAFPKYVFIPDYSVRVAGETFYVDIDFKTYRAGRAATQLDIKYKSDPKTSVTIARPGWRREVEETLTIVERDLKFKHHGRVVWPEAENSGQEETGLDADIELTTALFQGSGDDDMHREPVLIPPDPAKPSKWTKLRIGTLAAAAKGNVGKAPDPQSVSLPAAVIELLRARNARNI